ncbi:MAG: hypothetical protein KA128_14025 [Zoogloea sp.]|nr:hypothetical protein [Zoogloea sp.]
MKEGSALLVALLLAVGIAYWSDHYRLRGWGARPPVAEPVFPPSAARPPSAPAEHLEVAGSVDGAARVALCEELQEVILGVDAALLSPQSPAAIEQLAARRRMYVERRMALGC